MGKYHSSFQQTLWQLQITFAPDEYLELLARHSQPGDWLNSRVEIASYWDKLPRYLIARCPLCGVRFTNRADTHSLFMWGDSTGGRGRALSAHPENTVPCAHFVGVQKFINLNGNIPMELDYFPQAWGDVPVITPELLLHTAQTGVVMHSLPICRVERGAFTPKYVVYLLTYYAESPSAAHKAGGGGWTLFTASQYAGHDPRVGDLPYWVELGKLHWLDLDDPTLPLKSGPTSDFPYAGIQGVGGSYTYRKRPKPRWQWLDRSWHPDGVIYNSSENEVLARPSW